jgi:hypothetical protein
MREATSTSTAGLSRRQCLGTAGAIAATAAAPSILAAPRLGAGPSSDRITLGFIGTGRQAMGSNMGEPHVRFEGDKGWIQVHYFKTAAHPELIEASSPALLAERIGPGEQQFPVKSERADFIEACRSRGSTMEDAEVGQRTISLCHLAYISIQRGGARLRWDPSTERFADDPAANALLADPAPRAPWSLD